MYNRRYVRRADGSERWDRAERGPVQQVEQRVFGNGGPVWSMDDQAGIEDRLSHNGKQRSDLIAWAGQYGEALGRKFTDNDLEGDQGDLLMGAAVCWLDGYTGTFEFVQDVRRDWRNRGTIPQAALRGVLNTMRAELLRNTAATPDEQAFRPVFPAVAAMFKAAEKAGMKRPMFRLQSDTEGPYGQPEQVRIYLADRGDRYYVKVDDLYVGYLDERGEVDSRLERIASVMQVLQAVEADPLGTFADYGLKTKRCGICGRKLSDPESVRLGIGPICIGKMGW